MIICAFQNNAIIINVGKPFTFIELFGGCGGMSLGLESSGFDLYFANELSPMAAETFAYNIIGEDLSKQTGSKNVLWMRSNYPAHDLKNRLKENPFDVSNGQFSDLKSVKNVKALEGKLLVGDIKVLLDFLNESTNSHLRRSLVERDIDLVSGGPPCQGFSLAGKRMMDDKKNTLPADFAKLASIIKPKIVLLENVKGITAPFQDNGNKYFAWVEVSKAFINEGYLPVCMMLNSKFFDIAQNRPRFIMLGIREDVFKSFSENRPEALNNGIVRLRNLYIAVKKTGQLSRVDHTSLPLFDIERQKELFDGAFLPLVDNVNTKFVSAHEAIKDLHDVLPGVPLTTLQRNEYVEMLELKFARFQKKNVVQYLENHDYRAHSFAVKARFRYYQVLNELELNGRKKLATGLFTGTSSDHELESIFAELSSKKFFDKRNGVENLYVIESLHQFKNYVSKLATKKHSQRALISTEPAPAQLTIPDDICHYDQAHLRTMTVREIARLQSFPDWFIFKSKITTGGSRRSFEVPQYTQVGNAVPPLMAYHLGKLISNVLNTVSNAKKQGSGWGKER